MTIPIDYIDHVAVTVADLETSCRFYSDVLEARVMHEHSDENGVLVRQLSIGGAMLNVHRARHELTLVAANPTPGAIDLCFRWSDTISAAARHLEARGVEIIEGPCHRVGSDGADAMSVYFRDPDGNLIELLTSLGEN